MGSQAGSTGEGEWRWHFSGREQRALSVVRWRGLAGLLPVTCMDRDRYSVLRSLRNYSKPESTSTVNLMLFHYLHLTPTQLLKMLRDIRCTSGRLPRSCSYDVSFQLQLFSSSSCSPCLGALYSLAFFGYRIPCWYCPLLLLSDSRRIRNNHRL